MSKYKTCDSCKYYNTDNCITYSEGVCTFHNKDTRSFYKACDMFKRSPNYYPDYHKIIIKTDRADYYDTDRIVNRIKLLLRDTNEEEYINRIYVVDGFDDENDEDEEDYE